MSERTPDKFEEGYICALANVMHQHEDDTLVEDALRCIGWREINWSKVDENDRAALAPVLKEMRRKDKSKLAL